MKPLPSDTLLPSSSSSSSSSSSPTIGLQSPGLQAEFLRGKSHTDTTATHQIHNHVLVPDGLVCLRPVFRDKFQSKSDDGPSSRVSYPMPPSFSPTPSSPRTPTSSPSSPCHNSRQGWAGVSLLDWNILRIVVTLMSLPLLAVQLVSHCPALSCWPSWETPGHAPSGMLSDTAEWPLSSLDGDEDKGRWV